MPSVPWRFCTAALFLVLFASVAHGEDIQLWNFRGTMPIQTSIGGLTKAETTPEGLLIQTDVEGFIMWANQPIKTPTEVLTMRVKSPSQIGAFFMWTSPAGEEQFTFEIPFIIPATTEVPKDVNIIPSNFPTWDWRAEKVAIRFPAGANVLIEEATLRHWSTMEKFIEGWKSFWTYDTFRAYSINFLWGPLIATNAPARGVMFDTLPPFAWSATRIFYGLLLLAAVIGLVVRFLGKNAALGFGIFAAVFVGCWVIFDIRMGAEIIDYAFDDIDSYVKKEGNNQTLRSHGNLYAIINEALPVINQYDRYVLIYPAGSVYFANVRYMAYPSVPVREEDNAENVKLWAVFERRDILIDENNRLYKKVGTGTVVLSPPGKIVKQLAADVFLFAAD
jgi:hypothetical protein